MLLIDAADGRVADANKAAVQFYGYTVSVLKKMNIADITILPRREIKKHLSDIQAGKITSKFYKHRTAGNGIKDVQAFISPVSLTGKGYNFVIIQDVTELKKRETENNLFRSVVDNSASFIGIANMKREVIYMNRTMRTAFAVPENATLSDYRIFDFYTPRGLKNFKTVAKKVMQSGYWRGENEMRSLDGRIYTVMQTVILIEDEKGQPLFSSTMAIDITQQKKPEQEAVNLASRFRTFMNSSNEGLHIIDQDLRVVQTNRAFCRMLGYTSKELQNRRVTDWDCKWNESQLKKIFKKIMKTSTAFQTKYKRKDGQVIDVEISSVGIRIEGKDYLYAASRDVSNRVQLESALKESEHNLKLGELIGKIGYVKANMETGKIDFSFGARRIYGLKGEYPDVESLKIMRLPEYNDELEKLETQLIRENKPFEKEFRIKRANDGKIIDIHTKFTYNKARKMAFGTLQDITERKKVEEELYKSELKYQHLISDMQIGIVVHGPGGEIVFHNEKATELLGLTTDQLLGKTAFSALWNVIHEDGSDFPGDTHPASVALQTKKTVKNIVMGVYRPAMNDRVWLMVNAIPDTGSDGELFQVVVTFYDISEILEKDTEILRLNYELKELTRYLQRARVDERNKLALETHNKLGQKLVGLKFEADYIRKNLPDNFEQLKEKIKSITTELGAMLRDFSNIYNEVNPTLIEDLDLPGALENLCFSSQEKWNLKVDYQWKIKKQVLTHEIKWIIYKTIEGYLYHAFLYSKPVKASVVLSEQKAGIRIDIQYRGHQPFGKADESHLMINLIELRERIAASGGHVIIRYPAKSAVKISVFIPA